MNHIRLVSTLLTALIVAGGVAAADDADTFFDDTAVRSIHFTFDDPNWYQTLYFSHRDDPEDPYFPARFEYGGVVLEPVGVRFKGNSSFGIQGQKKSFKIDFNEYDEGLDGDQTNFLGLTKLNLNNGFKDPTMMRAKLFLDYCGEFGPSLRATHVRVYVNGEYWGLYTAVEQLDKNFVQRVFGADEDGNLFEGESTGDDPHSAFGSDLTWLGEDPAAYAGSYELKTNESENDWSGLVEFIDVLNNTPTEELPAVLEPLFDVDAWLLALAQDVLFLNLDSYVGSAHNYYLYERDDTGQFTYLHWDTNEAFGTFRYGLSPNEDMLSLDPFWVPTSGPPGSPALDRPLMENIWAVPEYRKTFLRRIAEMLRNGFDTGSFDERITTIADRIRPHVYDDPNKPYSNADFDNSLTVDLAGDRSVIYGLRHFVDARAGYLEFRLALEAEPGDLRLNEVLPVNHGTLPDEAGEYDPWLEIHNLGPGPVDLSRLSLSTDVNQPLMWALPPGPIDDGAFALVWADGETGEGSMHAGFALDPSAGEVFLFADGHLVDSIAWLAPDADISLARMVDGTGPWAPTDNPTPMAANRAGSTAPGLFLNEVMAENDSTISDPESDLAFPDWLEIFNGGDVDLDLGGLYLSDDADDPLKWRIPDGVAIEAGAHLLIWADNDPEQGPVHAPFKLDAEGETLVLSDRDLAGNREIDRIAFPTLDADVSFGRSTDGSPDLVMLPRPSPGFTNASAPRTATGRHGP